MPAARLPRRSSPGRRAAPGLSLAMLLACAASGFPALAAGTGTDDAAPAAAPGVARQSLDDAWWTGPIIANSATTLPKGHLLVEPYLYDAISDGGHSFGSLTYALYGVTDRLTVGAVPVFGYNVRDDGPDSTGIGAGDAGILMQYRLRSHRERGDGPDISLQVQETLPTGRYDRLDDRPGDGFGGGARSTLVQLNTQHYLWMPNGRILRMRANAGTTFYEDATVDGASVYGTPAGFHGVASPGDAVSANLAWEYSVTQRWVLALDLAWSRQRSTRLRGSAPSSTSSSPEAVDFDLPGRDTYALAPAVEYNFSPTVGVIFGIRYLKTAGAGDSWTPVVAINYVR